MTPIVTKTICALAAAAAAGACTTPVAHPPASFGDAVNHNIALQIVNPDGPTSQELVVDGERRALMAERYVTDTVTSPGEAKASEVSGGE